MAKGCVLAVTDERFQNEVLHHPGTVLVDFYTPWCPPCRQAAPVLEALCAENRPNFKIVKIDANENAKTAAEHNVLAVPTFVLYHQGQRIGQIAGFRSKVHFEQWITSSVAGAA